MKVNKHHKAKAIKRISRTMGNKACQFFLFGTPSCKLAFIYQLNRYTGLNINDKETDEFFSK